MTYRMRRPWGWVLDALMWLCWLTRHPYECALTRTRLYQWVASHGDWYRWDMGTSAWVREGGLPVVERGFCGSLDWTIKAYGRVTHKHSCPNRTDPWCQQHPDGCEGGPR